MTYLPGLFSIVLMISGLANSTVCMVILWSGPDRGRGPDGDYVDANAARHGVVAHDDLAAQPPQ